MKKGLTELVLILDRSGSMHGLEADTIGGFNSLIERQRSEPGEALVSTVLFNDNTQVLHDRVRLDEENASRVYTAQKVREMISHENEKYGWEFLFLGANIDAVETAGRIGISPDRAANYNCDSEGTRLNYEAMDAAVSAVRSSAPLDARWKDAIEEDFRKRGKK